MKPDATNHRVSPLNGIIHAKKKITTVKSIATTCCRERNTEAVSATTWNMKLNIRPEPSKLYYILMPNILPCYKTVYEKIIPVLPAGPNV